MEWLFIGLIKLLGSAGFGTVFGGVMGFFNRKADLQYRKMELDYELKQREVDAQILEKEWAARVKVANVEAESRVEEAYAQTMAKSYEYAQPEGKRMKAFSSFVRPFISLAYFIISSIGAGYILYYAFNISKVQFTNSEWFELANFVISWVAFMSGTTIGWWYAMRPGKAPSLR